MDAQQLKVRAEEIVQEHMKYPETMIPDIALVTMVTFALTEGATELEVDPAMPTGFPVRVPKKESRPKRWARCASEAEVAIGEARTAVEALKEVQEEYSEWKDNLPENLQQGSLAEKLDAVCDIDLDGAVQSLEEAENAVQEADSADLPLGFGRD